MKKLRYILLSLVIAAAVGLLCYQGFVAKDLETGDIVKAGLIIVGALLSMLRGDRTSGTASKKTHYQKAFPDFILNAFEHEPTQEKIFYSAVDDFYHDRHPQALTKLGTLRGECSRSTDIYAVNIFTALSSSRIGAYDKAVEHYKNALSIRPNSRLASNMGYCYQEMGDMDAAISAYEQAIRIDSTNPNPYNNLSSLYFQEGEYEQSLDLAKQALERNPKMSTALATAAICCSLLEDESGYESFYRRAVAAGYDGKTIKDVIQQLDPTI